MIEWSKKSDLFFIFTLMDDHQQPIDVVSKSFIYKFYTTNKCNAKIASYDKETNTFVNCKIGDEANKIEIGIEKPNFTVGNLNIEVMFSNPNDLFEDGQYNVWLSYPSDIMIIN